MMLLVHLHEGGPHVGVSLHGGASEGGVSLHGRSPDCGVSLHGSGPEGGVSLHGGGSLPRVVSSLEVVRKISLIGGVEVGPQLRMLGLLKHGLGLESGLRMGLLEDGLRLRLLEDSLSLRLGHVDGL